MTAARRLLRTGGNADGDGWQTSVVPDSDDQAGGQQDAGHELQRALQCEDDVDHDHDHDRDRARGSLREDAQAGLREGEGGVGSEEEIPDGEQEMMRSRMGAVERPLEDAATSVRASDEDEDETSEEVRGDAVLEFLTAARVSLGGLQSGKWCGSWACMCT